VVLPLSPAQSTLRAPHLPHLAHLGRGTRCGPGCDLAHGLGRLDPRRRTGRPSGPRAHAWPGLLLTATAVAVALLVAGRWPTLDAATVAVGLGVVVANLGLVRPALRHGTHVAAHTFLRAAVVLLGSKLALGQLLALGWRGLVVVLATVTVTFVGTRLLGRALGLPPARALLVATGFSVCGASAVAAMRDVAGADEDDTAVAVALVTLCGSLAIVLLPALRVPLHLDPYAFGSWVGASVHDVGQTVATASRVPGALDAAVVVKLTRVVLLAPLVAGTAVVRRRRARRGPVLAGAQEDGGRRPALVPGFVLGFVAAALVRSTGLVPPAALAVVARAQGLLLLAALFGVGTTITLGTLRRAGGRALLLGLGSWVLVAGVAYAGVRLVG